jgi:hypothetical protein
MAGSQLARHGAVSRLSGVSEQHRQAPCSTTALMPIPGGRARCTQISVLRSQRRELSRRTARRTGIALRGRSSRTAQRGPSSRAALPSSGTAYVGYCHVCGSGPSCAGWRVTRPHPDAVSLQAMLMTARSGPPGPRPGCGLAVSGGPARSGGTAGGSSAGRRPRAGCRRIRRRGWPRRPAR